MKFTIIYDGHEGRMNQLDFILNMCQDRTDIFYEFLIIQPEISTLGKITGLIGNSASNFDFEHHIAECKSQIQGKFKETNHEILMEEGNPEEIILKYSRFTDCIILPYKSYISHPNGQHDKGLLRNTLRKAHSPCIVLPNRPIQVDHIIFTYDDSNNCIDAIRRFNYLLRCFAQDIDSRVVYVKDDQDLHPTDMRPIQDYLNLYYKNFKIKELEGDVHSSIYNYSKVKGHAFAVLGSFGRGVLSEKIEESVAEQFIEKARYPIFVYHN